MRFDVLFAKFRVASALAIFINSKPRCGFARQVDSPLSRGGPKYPQQDGDSLAGDATMDVLQSRC